MDRSNLERPLEHFERTCREAGLKLTFQRQEIYRELMDSCDHPSAETLYRRLAPKIPMLALDTVYRSLAVFAKHGLVQKLETTESQARFDANAERHHHAICSQCNEITDFHCPSVDDVQLPEVLESWGRIERRGLVVYGICRKCEKNRDDAQKKSM